MSNKECARVNEYELCVGAKLFFGNKFPYWTVLDIDNFNNTIYVLCDDAVGWYEFDHDGCNMWEQSSLYSWLNNEFVAMNFSEAYRGAIDKITILDSTEVSRYINGNLSMLKECSWWLKSLDTDGKSVEYVCYDGTVESVADIKGVTKNVVPALLLDVAVLETLGIIVNGDFNKKMTCVREYNSIDGILFNADTLLSELEIGSEVISIAKNAFYCNYNLTDITLGNNVRSIGRNAFGCCYSLSRVVFPEGLINIDEGAFSHCNDITNIDIPGSVKYIGNFAFEFCDELERLSLAGCNTEFGNGVFNFIDKLVIHFVNWGDFEFYPELYMNLEEIDYFQDGNILNRMQDKDKINFEFIRKTDLSRITLAKNILNLAKKDCLEAIDFIKKNMVYFVGIFIEHEDSEALSYILANKYMLSDNSTLGSFTLEWFDNCFEEIQDDDCIEIKALLMDFKHKLFTADEIRQYELEKIGNGI